MDNVPKVIKQYRLENLLGAGSFGDVYRAHDEKLNRDVAIKIASPQADKDLAYELGKRFELEVGATVKLNHPNIVTVYDTGSVDDLIYYVMEHLPGGDLKKNSINLRSNESIVQVCIDVCKGLAYAHDMGFIHRDIKPENILFDAHGNAVIADFGIVKAMGEDLTQGRYVMGTPSYSAPEQMSGDNAIDGRADLYSLGKVLYFMLMKRKYTPELDSNLPESKRIFQATLDKLLSSKPDDRYTNAHVLLKHFQELQLLVLKQNNEATVVNAAPTPLTNQSRKKLLIPITISATVLVVLFLIFLFNTLEINGSDDPINISENDQLAGGRKNPDSLSVEGNAVVQLNTNPPGAEVWVDGERKGQTPIALKGMPVGTVSVLLKHKYHADLEIELDTSRDKTTSHFAELNAGYGGLSINSKPHGASVYIDGKLMKGSTPIGIDRVPAGARKVELRKDSLSFAENIEVRHGETSLLSADLNEGALIAFGDDWFSVEGLFDQAGREENIFVKMKIYLSIVNHDPENERANTLLFENTKITIQSIQHLAFKHQYDEARKLAEFVDSHLLAYSSEGDVMAALNEQEQKHKETIRLAEFDKQKQSVEVLIKQNHFDEADTLIHSMRSSYDDLPQWLQLESRVSTSKERFNKNVLEVTGPLQSIKLRDKKLRVFTYEATFSQWDACYKDGDCSRKPNDYGWGRGSRPVVDVSHHEVVSEFIPWLSQKTKMKFRLPSEKEWIELFGSEVAISNKYANGPSGFNWGEDASDYTAKVGSYLANNFGLYDMAGNVWEWVSDCGEQQCLRYVLKGGSWNSAPKFFSPNERWLEAKDKRSNDIGFRLVADY